MEITQECHLKRSKFNVEVPYHGRLLLYNTASMAFCVLDEEGQKAYYAVDDPAEKYRSNLVKNGFWVNREENEDFLQEAKRQLGIFTPSKEKRIVIAPTLRCNARCYYCFEQDREMPTMTQETIKDVIEFIVKYCKEAESLTLSWFGGEPLLASDTISQILAALKERLSIPISSTMTTNGSMINEDVVRKMVEEWGLKNLQITLDGRKEYYHKVKDYYLDRDHFSGIMRAIDLMIEKGISVLVRVNVSYENVQEAEALIAELGEKYSGNKHFGVRFMFLLDYGEGCRDKRIVRGEADYQRISERIFDVMAKYGFFQPNLEAFQVRNVPCSALTVDSLIIDPLGDFYKCENSIGEKSASVGNVRFGIIHNAAFTDWCRCDLPSKCENCAYLPFCQGGCKQMDHLCALSKYLLEKTLIMIYNNKKGG